MTFTTFFIIWGIVLIIEGLLIGVLRYFYICRGLRENRSQFLADGDTYNSVLFMLIWGDLAIINALKMYWTVFAGCMVFFLVNVATYEFYTRFAPKASNAD